MAVELGLVCLERTASTDAVMQALEAPGVRPGRISELLALGAERHDPQRSFPILARIPFLRDRRAFAISTCAATSTAGPTSSARRP